MEVCRYWAGGGGSEGPLHMAQWLLKLRKTIKALYLWPVVEFVHTVKGKHVCHSLLDMFALYSLEKLDSRPEI